MKSKQQIKFEQLQIYSYNIPNNKHNYKIEKYIFQDKWVILYDDKFIFNKYTNWWEDKSTVNMKIKLKGGEMYLNVYFFDTPQKALEYFNNNNL